MWVLTSGSGSTTLFLPRENPQFKDSLNWIKGRHNFKFGYEMLHLLLLFFIVPPGFTFNVSGPGDPWLISGSV